MIAIGNEVLKFEVSKQNTITVLTSGRKEVRIMLELLDGR